MRQALIEKYSKFPSVVQNGFPALASSGDGSSSSRSSKNEKCDEAELIVSPFRCELIWTERKDDAIWKEFRKKNKLTYSSEKCINFYVRTVLGDVFDAAGLAQYISCAEDLAVTDKKPDVWIITDVTGIPIGVVEVKKPSKKIMSEKRLHGQIYDYMLRLRSFYGRRDVFGIETTYDEWRIVWLPDCDQVANSKLDLPNDDKIRDPDLYKRETGEIIDFTKRVIHGTKTFRHDDPQLVNALYTTLWRMYLSPVDPVELIDPDRWYIVMKKGRWFWNQAFQEIENLTLRDEEFPIKYIKKEKGPDSFSQLILLNDFRGGTNGRVWRACSRDGQLCVIKFLRNGTKEDLENETKNWNQVDTPQVQVIPLGKSHALVMPFYETFKDGEKLDSEQKETIRKAIRALAESGFVHKDLHLRHVARKKSGEITFIDRERLEEISEEKQNEAIGEMEKGIPELWK